MAAASGTPSLAASQLSRMSHALAPRYFTFAPFDVVPDALVLQCTHAGRRHRGPRPISAVWFVEDDEAKFTAQSPSDIDEATPSLSDVLVDTSTITPSLVLGITVVGGLRGFGCLRVRIQLVRAVPLLVELVTGGGRLVAVGGGLLLQTGGLGRLHVGFGLGGAGLGGSLVGECLLLPDVECLLLGGAADLVGFDVAVLVAFGARQPRQPCDEQNCRDRDDDDQNDSAGSDVGSSRWLSMVDGFLGGDVTVCVVSWVGALCNSSLWG